MEDLLDGCLQDGSLVTHLVLTEGKGLHIKEVRRFYRLEEHAVARKGCHLFEGIIPSAHVLSTKTCKVVRGNLELEEDKDILLQFEHLTIVVLVGLSDSRRE